ncbi:MAG: site-specific integrase [Chloroflexi bacterium]|nr:site-specific integrase [Chloroflexota bacterium]
MPEHRGRGQGTVNERQTKQGTVYQAQISVSGERLTKTVPTKTAANRWIREQLTRADQGLLSPDGAKVTVGAYVAQWLSNTAPSLKPGTQESYAHIVKEHLSKLAKIRLTDLRPDHVQAIYAEKLADELAPRTVRNIHNVLHHALDDAMKAGLVARNVCDAVTAPKAHQSEMKVWTPEQARVFLASVQGHRLEALYRLALSCGMRAGEILALRWADVDLKARRLHVQRSIRRIAKQGIAVTEPKTAHGRRQIVVPINVAESLKEWRKRQLQDRLLAGSRWREGDYVFTSRVGTPLERHNVYREFIALGEKADLPRIRLHDLRHTCATLLLLTGRPVKAVSEMLGHASVTITLEIYAHVLPTMQDDIADTMDRLLAAT